MQNNQISEVLGVVAMEPKGEYNADTFYEKLNVVTYNKSSYVAKQKTQGNLPTDTTYWQLLGGGMQFEDIVDNLESTATDKPLSAKQGKILKDLIDLILERLDGGE